MPVLSIDIETYSSVDLTKSGVYPYAESPDFEILLFAYAFDGGTVEVAEIAAGETLPDRVLTALTDPLTVKTAFNAAFERVCISRFFGLALPADQWECSMARAAMCGLPLSLAAASEALKLQRPKLNGKGLINFFTKPRVIVNQDNGLQSLTASYDIRTRNTPEDDPAKWRDFVEYNRRDVAAETDIRKAVEWFPVTDAERRLWLLDQKINGAGVRIDRELVDNALELYNLTQSSNLRKARELTGLDNPNSAAQLRKWVEEETGAAVESLSKAAVAEIIDALGGTASEVLALRQELAKTSVKKYAAMQNAVCADGRIRGLLQYYGANRTGRWAGRLVQVQNLPKNFLPDLALARKLVKDKRYDDIKLLYGNVPDTLSQLIRTAFIPEDGKAFIVADFSAVEARIIAWYAGETWRNKVFATHGKIYEASAAQMFKAPIDAIVKGSLLRQKGKVAELALGYQGGVGALKRMGALEMGIDGDELEGLVTAWRSANSKIVDFWRDIEDAAMDAVRNRRKVKLRNIEFLYGKRCLFIRLPSGRMLTYVNARIEAGGKFDRERIVYSGVSQTTRKWEQSDTYGGKLVENIVQATARDCLGEAMLRLDEAGYKIVMHVHDEVIIEGGADQLDGVCGIMGRTVDWAEGLLLRAEGFVSDFYKKD
ncbi:MAG: DNA polymerase [Clostridiales bacterium]|jgi:DNA polymerase|nr:DNA polymerase [Clostridiales bacterium]